jgi:hypothetical protein
MRDVFAGDGTSSELWAMFTKMKKNDFHSGRRIQYITRVAVFIMCICKTAYKLHNIIVNTQSIEIDCQTEMSGFVRR